MADTAVVMADGCLLVGGECTTASGAAHKGLARPHLDGSADGSFNPSFSDTVSAFLIQTDGKILVTSAFTYVNKTPRKVKVTAALPVGVKGNVVLPIPAARG